MRMRSLRVKSYGHFGGLDAPLDGEGVQMIVGPNEAGKTTLLEFVRELLFGFDERTRYKFGEKDRPEGAATLVLDSGTVVELNRRKGRKKTVSVRIDGAESDLDDEGFNGLLGDASENLFRSIFAFGLDELAAGEKSLGDPSVRSALYSGGAAGAVNPKKALEALQAEADRLYKPKSTTLVINKSLNEIVELSRLIKSKSIRCEAYHQRQAELDEAEAEAAAAAERRRAATRDLGLRRKLAQAFPHWLELGRFRTERAGLAAPEGFPSDGRALFEYAEKEIARSTAALGQAREASEANARELSDVRFDARLIDRRAEIEGLNQAIQAVKDARRDLPVDRRKHEESIRKAAARVASLVPGWTLDDLRGFRWTAEREARVDALTAERDERAAALNDLARTRESHLETLHDKQSALAALGEPIDAAPLASALEDEAEYKSDLGALKRLEAEKRKTRRDIDGLLPRLRPPLDRPSCEAVELPTPPRESIGPFKADFQRIKQQIDAATTGIEKSEKSLGELEGRLASLSARADDLPTLEGLADLRRRRDLGWDLVRRKHVDHEAVESEVRAWLLANTTNTAHDLLDAYRTMVLEADQYADGLFHQSNAVALRAQVQAMILGVQEERRSLEGLKAVHEARLEDWRELWAECGVAPLAPEAMEGWLDRLEELRGLQQRAVENEQEGRAVRESVVRFEDRLRTLLGEAGSDGPTLLAAAREREKRLRADDQARRDLQRDVRQLQERVDRAEARRAELLGEEAAWADHWRSVPRELRFPDDWDAGLTGKVLRALKSAFIELEAADDLAGRIAAHEARLAEFEPRVRAITDDLAPDLTHAAPELAAAVLQTRLTEALQGLERKANLEKNRADLQRVEAEHEASRAAAVAERTTLFEAAGVESAEAFRALADRVARIAELDKAIKAKEDQLDVLREHESLDALLGRLDGADGEVLKADLVEAEALHDELEKRLKAANQTVGSRRNALSEFQKGSGEAAGLLEAVSARRAELAAAVDRYVPLMFARHLLSQAVQRFEQDSQPEVVRETSRIFQTMTAGRFTRVERPRGEDDAPLLVHRVDAEVLEPHQLSTGTREQLYLAVRLAYALHYCGRAESLPIVMDDVLANFDDDRARSTLRALDDVSKRVQVILFTCHPHLVELGREVFPGFRPLSIPELAAAEGGEAQPSRAPRSRRRPLLDASPSA